MKDEPLSPRENGVYEDFLGRITASERPNLSVDEYLDLACGALGGEVGELASRRKEPRLRDLRELATVVGVETGPRDRRGVAEDPWERQPVD